MNRIKKAFELSEGALLNIFFTAGYPRLDDTMGILRKLQEQGVQMVEIGMPFSDPLADGPVIQQCSEIALQNGMNLEVLFEQLAGMRKEIDIPVILMGYVNQVLQYGVELFCARCAEVGVDGLILPDLPLEEYRVLYKATFDKYGLGISFLVTPRSSNERIQLIDELSSAFLYIVSQSSTTGSGHKDSEAQLSYFERIKTLDTRNKKMIGFGINSQESFENACRYGDGAIIGTAFLKALKEQADLPVAIEKFIEKIVKQAV